MASTVLLLAVLQLLSTALCIATGDVITEVKDTDTDKGKDDLDTEETGWIYNPIQEKVRTLEYLKSKVLSPLKTLQSPSTFYGGGYPIYYNGGGGYSSSLSYGGRYPYYNGYKNNYLSGYYRPGVSYSGYAPLKNKFNLYSSYYPQRAVYSPKWYNKGYYGGSTYAPGCTYPSYKPSYSVPSTPYVSYGTPLSYQYTTSSAYGVPSASFSSKASFGAGFGVKSGLSSQYSGQGYVATREGSLHPAISGFPGAEAFPPPNPSLPQIPESPYEFQPPSFPSTTPSTPLNPSDFAVKAVIFPHRASDEAQTGLGSYAPSVPSLPEGAPTLPAVPSSPYTPSLPSTPQIPSAPQIPSNPQIPSSPSLPSYPGYLPSTPSPSNFPNPSNPLPSNPLPTTPSYSNFQSFPYKPTFRQDYNAILSPQNIEDENREVIITPAPPKAKINLITALPGSSIGISPDFYPYEPNPAYVSYYPNVFYISNQQNNVPSAAVVSETDSQSVTPISTEDSTDTTTPSSDTSTVTASQRSSRPIATFYSSNTIDQTRIPLFYTAEQYAVPASGFYFSSPANSNGPLGFTYNNYNTPQSYSAQLTKSSNIIPYPGQYSGFGQGVQQTPSSSSTASPPC